MAFHVIHYGEVKVLLLDLAAKREWFKIIFSNSERVMVQNLIIIIRSDEGQVTGHRDHQG